jgi:hypothetical protein
MTAMSTAARAQYEGLLVRLHAEMRAGRGDEAPANELRNEMAAVWYGLGDDEHAVCDELSEDLYIIEGKRARVPLSEGELPKHDLVTHRVCYSHGGSCTGLCSARRLLSLWHGDVDRCGDPRRSIAFSGELCSESTRR